MKIEILGTGCAKCNALEANTKVAAESLGLTYELGHVTSLNDIAARGVMMTPALMVDGQLKSSGRLLSPEQIKSLLAG